MAQDKRSLQCCRSWRMLHAQCTSALSSGFPVSQGNAEALDRLGGKIKHRLISYFLSNNSAKNCRTQIVYVKIIASEKQDVLKHNFQKHRASQPNLKCLLMLVLQPVYFNCCQDYPKVRITRQLRKAAVKRKHKRRRARYRPERIRRRKRSTLQQGRRRCRHLRRQRIRLTLVSVHLKLKFKYFTGNLPSRCRGHVDVTRIICQVIRRLPSPVFLCTD